MTIPGPITGAVASAAATASIVDRVDFGASASEKAHALNAGSTGAVMGVGAFEQSYRQPRLIKNGTAPGASDKLTFTLAVDPVKQNYLTVKLYGSDTQFGVLQLADLWESKDRADTDRPGFSNQLDNNLSNSPSNPAFYGRFHYATTTLPMSMTAGKTSVELSLFSSGYYYDSGGDRVGQPTRPIYSAFSHTDPYFVPPAADKTGPALLMAGAEPPGMIDKASVFAVLKRSRAKIHGLDGYPAGGDLAYRGSVIAPGTPGAPVEVIGMHIYDGAVSDKIIGEMNGYDSPADAWRDHTVGRQNDAIAIYTAAYTSPPLRDFDGNVVPGYDRYLDPLMLDRLIGLLDGQARSQGGGEDSRYKWVSTWDYSCNHGNGTQWGGVTSSPRKEGPWKGTQGRHGWDCLTFADQWNTMGMAILKLLENPQTAAPFKKKLEEKIDAEFNGKLYTRAHVYERMMGPSAGLMGFNLKALTSNDYFDKFGGTVAQAMIWVGNAYSAQLALRALQESFPSTNTDEFQTEALDPATMRTIVRQLLALDDMVFMQDARPGYRVITRGGISETYGSLASGHDGRYGDGLVQDAARMATLVKYDKSFSAAEREDAAEVVRKAIRAFSTFLNVQHSISTAKDGTAVGNYQLGPEDAISWRVPYGPNANGWKVKVASISVAPSGAIRSPEARRAFLLNVARDGVDGLLWGGVFYKEDEDAWKSIAGVDPATLPKLPGEPGAPDSVWADVDSGALAMYYRGERLFFNAQYNRSRGRVNQYVRVHHITDLVDRQATVHMPFDAATQQSDGNLSGGFDDAWVVRYGHYLVVMNRSKTDYAVKLPAGSTAHALRRNAAVTAASGATVAAGDYEVFTLP